MTSTLPEIEEDACLGAAILGGFGAGVYTGYNELKDRVRRKETQVKPNPAKTASCDELFRNIYVRLYGALAIVNAQISDRFEGR